MRKRKKRALKTASLRHERRYSLLGLRHIVGVDEAGRGPWAGPVAAGAVCLPLERDDLPELLKGVRDSKLTPVNQRDPLAEVIKEVAITWGVGSASAEEIDAYGIVPATARAMQRAVEDALAKIDFMPDCLFIDDMLLPMLPHIPQVSLVGGDERSLSIAAASIIAKTWRDAYMAELDAQYPQYGFAAHKGYGTPGHQAALRQYGPSPAHRVTFRPVANWNVGGDGMELDR
jgi:ribonuclease HII